MERINKKAIAVITVLTAALLLSILLFVVPKVREREEENRYRISKDEYVRLRIEYMRQWADKRSDAEYEYIEDRNGSALKHREIITLHLGADFDLLPSVQRFHKAESLYEGLPVYQEASRYAATESQYILDPLLEADWLAHKNLDVESWHTTVVLITDRNIYRYFPNAEVFEDRDGIQRTLNMYGSPPPGAPIVPIAPAPRAPAIGMTEQEVRNSTWGDPDKINRRTTAYGITEQWVYSGYRYIYFDDGVVTSISDSR